MEKTIMIDGKAVPFKCTGGFLVRYKEMTGRDPLQDIDRLSQAFKKIKSKEKTADITSASKTTELDLSKVDSTVLFEVLWVLARTADHNVPSLLEWLDQFEVFPLNEIYIEIQDLLVSAFMTSKKAVDLNKKKVN